MADTWSVVDQRETVDTTGGHSVDSVRVTYKSSSGIVGNVLVPTSTYNGPDGPAIVASMINAALARHMEIRALSSATQQAPVEGS